MRDIKLFLAGLGFILFGCALWQVQPELRLLGLAIVGLAYLSIAIGAIAEVVWLCRLSTPLFEKILDLRHKSVQIRHQENEMLLRLQVVQYAQMNRLQLEMGDMKVTYPSHPMVQVQEEKRAQLAAPSITTPLQLPGHTLMIDVMRSWPLSLDNLFLAYARGRQSIACSLSDFMHVAHDAPTGMGKTAQFYAEMIMLLKLGIQVIFANPHFAPVGKNGDDWRPIGKAIEAQGLITIAPDVSIPGLIRNYATIANMLKWLATVEIDRRFAMQAEGNYNYNPIYIFIDEWPAVVRRHPEAAEYQVDVLQRGRAVEVCVDTNAQGFLQNDVDLKGSARENFNTAYHMGGSVYSGSKLLDMPVRDINALLRDEQLALGKGIALLRNNVAAPQAQLVRLPYAENNYAYYMLGRADEWQLPEVRARRGTVYTRETPVYTRETATEDDLNIVTGAFPASLDQEPASVVVDTTNVSKETRATIRRMDKEKIAHRKIAVFVGLSGRNYPVYRQVCKEENIVIAEQVEQEAL